LAAMVRSWVGESNTHPHSMRVIVECHVMPFDVVFRTLQDPLDSTLAGIAPCRAIVLSRFLTEYLLGVARDCIDERKDHARFTASVVLASTSRHALQGYHNPPVYSGSVPPEFPAVRGLGAPTSRIP